MSTNTIESYTICVRTLATHYNTAPTQLTEKQVRDFFLYIKNTKKLSSQSYNVYHSAIKYFYTLFNKEHLMKSIPKCKVHKSKPIILSKQEIIRIIDSIYNIKHKVIISLLYPAELRVSEVVNLKLTNIDKDRRQIFVRNAKDNKDRYT
ncbi:MAG: phage integrase N-terminal SAM-like domain-containing protein [Leptospiraceae bacterium]|nr:phage integrase N-terminal SAM-like domain-containing protein [Leptospiraceae bacterium]MCP5495978.1 phage integrase N-terminal SAM-like domain-containing protein [Leptospiraceae bacterium]